MALPGFLSVGDDGVLVAIKLQPRASSNSIGPAAGNELRVRVTAPPLEAAANDALIRLLADRLDWPRSRIELVRGHTSRHKLVKIYGIQSQAVAEKLGSEEK